MATYSQPFMKPNKMSRSTLQRRGKRSRAALAFFFSAQKRRAIVTSCGSPGRSCGHIPCTVMGGCPQGELGGEGRSTMARLGELEWSKGQ